MNGQRANPPAGHAGVCAVLIDVLPILPKSAPPREIVAALARLTAAVAPEPSVGAA